ncbi:hypothetical protein D3C85_536690 [compost metagenome]
MKTAEEADPVGYGGRDPVGRYRVAGLGRFHTVELILLVHRPGENPYAVLARVTATGGTAQGLPGVAGVFDARVGALQKQPLLGIKLGGLAGCDIEKQRIKTVDIIEKATPDITDVLQLRVRLLPSLRGQTRNTVAARRQVAPELVQVVGHGIATGHADDCNVLCHCTGNAGLIVPKRNCLCIHDGHPKRFKCGTLSVLSGIPRPYPINVPLPAGWGGGSEQCRGVSGYRLNRRGVPVVPSAQGL